MWGETCFVREKFNPWNRAGKDSDTLWPHWWCGAQHFCSCVQHFILDLVARVFGVAGFQFILNCVMINKNLWYSKEVSLVAWIHCLSIVTVLTEPKFLQTINSIVALRIFDPGVMRIPGSLFVRPPRAVQAVTGPSARDLEMSKRRKKKKIYL